MDRNRVLVVDDEETIQHVLRSVLEENGCEVRVAESAESGLRSLESFKPGVALVDIVLPGMNGLQMLGEIKRISGDTEILIMTSHSSAETARQAIKNGAYDYLQKPFEDLDTIWTTVQRALEKRALALKRRAVREEQERRTQALSTTVGLKASGLTPAQSESFSQLLGFFVGLVAQELDVGRVSLMLLNEETRELHIGASRGVDDVNVEAVRVPLGEGVAGKVALNGEPMLVSDIKDDPSLQRESRTDLGDSFISAPVILSVPIKSEQSVLGVINVTNRRSGRPFTQDDVTYLVGLAEQLATAIDGMKRSGQLQAAYESLKATQDQLVFSERIKVIGQMAAGVAHDFNNTLSILLGRAQFALRRLETSPLDVEKIRTDLGTILKCSLQGAETIKRIQEYTRIRKDVPEAPIDLKQVVKDAVGIARPKWKGQSEAEGRPINVRMDLADVPSIRGNMYELTQVVENLIFNAVEAMPKGGDLTFRTSPDAGMVILEVTDTGIGMDEATRKRLFEPFFTTKERGHGLGTSIIYGIVTRHQGTISVQSEVGKGTTFRVALPMIAPGAARRAAPDRRAAAPFVPARVLLVDDEDMVRNTFHEALAFSGHSVVSARSGQEALQRFDQQTFDLVITDLSMDGMSGLDVAREIKHRQPSLPVILLSGWSVQQQEESVREAGIDHILVKPCLIEDLQAVIQEVIPGADRH